jgi:hypothetical protein
MNGNNKKGKRQIEKNEKRRAQPRKQRRGKTRRKKMGTIQNPRIILARTESYRAADVCGGLSEICSVSTWSCSVLSGHNDNKRKRKKITSSGPCESLGRPITDGEKRNLKKKKKRSRCRGRKDIQVSSKGLCVCRNLDNPRLHP